MKRIGFTGTRHGLTEAQTVALVGVLRELGGDFFHHGDCVGADDEASILAECEGYKLVCHPPIDNTHRAFSKHNSFVLKPKSHFARNRDIVNDTEALVGCPQYADPITKDTMGGTAYTINFARKQKRPVLIVRPDGSVEKEGFSP